MGSALYGAYKSGKRALQMAHNTNAKRLGAAAIASTNTIFTGAGKLGDNAGSIRSEEESTKSEFQKALETASSMYESTISTQEGNVCSIKAPEQVKGTGRGAITQTNVSFTGAGKLGANAGSVNTSYVPSW